MAKSEAEVQQATEVAEQSLLDQIVDQGRFGSEPAARERFVVNLGEYGNTSSASIPLALDEAVRRGDVEPGHVVLLCAMGAGFAWAAAVLRW